MLVLFRIAGLMVSAPLLSSAAIPLRIRAFIALVLALAVFPLVGQVGTVPNSLAALAVAAGGEVVLGLLMGFAVSLVFTGIQVGAEMVGQQMGFSMAQLVDPLSQITTDVLSQFYLLLATLIFVLMNGHLVLIKSLAHTFQTVPLLQAPAVDANLVHSLVSILADSFILGVRVAGPALVAIFLATAALGFISRTVPQLNILAAGFPVNISLAFILLAASIGVVFTLFHNSILTVFADLGRLFA